MQSAIALKVAVHRRRRAGDRLGALGGCHGDGADDGGNDNAAVHAWTVERSVMLLGSSIRWRNNATLLVRSSLILDNLWARPLKPFGQPIRTTHIVHPGSSCHHNRRGGSKSLCELVRVMTYTYCRAEL